VLDAPEPALALCGCKAARAAAFSALLLCFASIIPAPLLSAPALKALAGLLPPRWKRPAWLPHRPYRVE